MELWQRFTHRARRSILIAHDEATMAGQHVIGTEHLLLGLLRVGEGTGGGILDRLGVDREVLHGDLRKLIARGPEEREPAREISFTPEALRVLQRAYEVSRERSEPHIGTEHLLLGVLDEPRGVAFAVLRQREVTTERVVETVDLVRQEGRRPTIPGRRPEGGSRELGVRALQETLREAHESLATMRERLSEAAELLGELERADRTAVHEPDAGSETMTRQALSSERIPPAVGPYSQAVRAGELLFCSGIVGLSPETGKLLEGEFEAEVRQVLGNLRTLLEDCGTGLAHVVKTTVFLMDMTQFSVFNGIYAEYFPEDPPARSTVQVAALPLGARIEVEAIALVR